MLSHPKRMIFMLASIILPRANKANITTTRMTTNATMLSMAGEAPSNHPAIHPLTSEENLNDSHTPRIIDMMATTWAMRPFLSPFMIAGTKHKRIIISMMFIVFFLRIFAS